MRKYLYIVCLLIPVLGFSQEVDKSAQREARSLVREGNELFNNQQFDLAAEKYLQATQLNPTYDIAQYNLGNALIGQQKFQEGMQAYEKLLKTTKNRELSAKAMHNAGNLMYQNKDYQKAIEMYKQSLRFNPKDEETRYNLALAKEKLEEQQNQDQDQNQDDQNQDNKDDQNEENKDNKDQQDKDQDQKDGDDQKDKDKEKDNEGDKDEDKQNGDGNDEQEQNPENNPNPENQQPQPGQMSPQQVEQLLDAMNNEEKKTQEKINAQRVKGQQLNHDKDW